MPKDRTPVIVVVLATVIMAINTLHSAITDYQDDYLRAQKLVVDLARVVEAHILATLKAADRTLVQTGRLVREAGGIERLQDPILWERMGEQVLQVNGAQSLWIFDTNGNTALETLNARPRAINVARREYFKEALETPGLHVGPAVRTYASQNVYFMITRQLTDDAGKAVGVAAFAMDTAWLTDFYALFGFGLEPAIAVLRRDGGVVARRPGMDQWVGKTALGSALFREQLPNASDGFYESSSTIDGHRRLIAYRTVAGSDLIVSVGVERKLAMAGWGNLTLRTVAVNVLSLLLFAAAVVWGFRHRRRGWETGLRLAEAAVVTQQLGAELRQAQSDPLTGLPNRALLLDGVGTMLRHARRGVGQGIALLYIDLDDFKPINDRFGHERGDLVLKAVARTLQSQLRDGDLAGRLGGDEFAVCIAAPRETVQAVAGQVAARIIDAVQAIDHGVGCSIGIAVPVANTQDLDAVMRDADAAMYQAKRTGKNRSVVFTPSLETAPAR